MLDDYGSTIAACLDFYQATFETRYAVAAAELAQQAVADFYDASLGTFWFQRTGGEALFARKQENDDSVTPSAMPKWPATSSNFPASFIDPTGAS